MTALITHGRRCWYCGARLGVDHKPLTFDHVIPRAEGGRGQHSNLVPACRKCNGAKGSLSLEEYRRTLEIKRREYVIFHGEWLDSHE